LQVGAICLQYSHYEVTGKANIHCFIGTKLQYSCICICVVCALWAKGQAFILVLLDK